MPIIKQSLGFKRITGSYQIEKGNQLTLTGASEYSSASPTESYVRWNGPKSGSITVTPGYQVPVSQTGLSGYQNTSRVTSNNVVGTIFLSPSVSNNPTSVQFFMIGGGGGGGSPRGNGSGGQGGGGGYIYSPTFPLGPGNYPISAGGGGSYAGCSNQSGTGGQQSSAFGYTAGSGGGGVSEHNGNCNGCWPGGPGSSSFASHTNGSGGGCNFGSGAGTNPISLNLTGSPYNYGGEGNFGGRSWSSGTSGTVVIRFSNSAFINVVTTN